MGEKQPKTTRPFRQSKSFRYILIALILLLFILFFRKCHEQFGILPPHVFDAMIQSDSLTQSDSIFLDSAGFEVTDTLNARQAAKTDSSGSDTNTADPDSFLTLSKPEDFNVVIMDESGTSGFPEDSIFVYADPWGGRHFDSVSVTLHCKDSCFILYGFEDSTNLQSYEKPFTIRRDKILWIAGMDENGNQSKAKPVVYIIEKSRKQCPHGMMPFNPERATTCMDMFEWPNLPDELPTTFISHDNALDSCASVGKRLCTEDEWQYVCKGPEKFRYPYGNQYNENYCPAKEKGAVRSGRFPVCRSYFGTFDMTGNVWEWTATPSTTRPGHYMVVGGNWTTGNRATCAQTKYSFYPQNRYLFVGFRCCKDVIKR